jgi:hypothetical protein
MGLKQEKQASNSRLAKNFHRTFMPERQFLGALLKYAAGNGTYDLQSIADATGIPTGKSSGKALPTADYSMAMGLVKFKSAANKPAELCLSDFGRIVFLEDKFCREELTQWIAHCFLCNEATGAEVWYQLFWNGAPVFGNAFSRSQATAWLETMMGGKDATKAVAPAFSMYDSEASFAQCGALHVNGDAVFRKSPPIKPSYRIGYAAWLSQCVEDAGRGGAQVTVDELERLCGFRSITSWSLPESQQVLAFMEQKGLVSVDRHMHPWIVCFKFPSRQLWNRLFEEFI